MAPEHAAAFRSLTERVCRGERGTLEFELIGLKGTRRWMETHAVPFRDEASGETRLLAITRDITERRRAEQALRESEQRFQLFMENLPANAWIRDAQFRYTYVNRRYAKTWSDTDPAACSGADADRAVSTRGGRLLSRQRREGARAGHADPVRGQPAFRALAEGEVSGAGRQGRHRRGRHRRRHHRAQPPRGRAGARASGASARSWTMRRRSPGSRTRACVTPTSTSRSSGYHGRAAQDVLGRDDIELFPADDARLLQRATTRKCCSGAARCRRCARCRSRDGTHRDTG